MSLFLPWSPFQNLDRFWRLIGGGEGDPEGKPERTSGPTSCLQNAYRDWHRDATQKDNPCRRSGSKARSCREKALSLIKSSKHKGEYIHIYTHRCRLRFVHVPRPGCASFMFPDPWPTKNTDTRSASNATHGLVVNNDCVRT